MLLRTFVMALLSLLFVSPVLAYKTRPYAGLNVNVNVPQGDFGGNNLAAEEGGARNGYGVEVDVGLAGDIADAYVGYCIGVHDAESSAFGARAEGDWTINQWVAGVRVHPKRLLGQSFMPLLGLALTGSRATADATGYIFGDTLTAKETSENEISVMLEGGCLVKMSAPSDLVLTLQYHDFDAYFDHPLWNGSLNISYLTLHLGVVYRL